MKDNCVICFENVDSTTFIKKWECAHLFHDSCIEHWDHNCPLCRNTNIIIPEITWSISRNPQCSQWMNQNQHLLPTILEHRIPFYKSLWKDSDCIGHDHHISYYHLNPVNKTVVIGICEDCNTFQKFV